MASKKQPRSPQDWDAAEKLQAVIEAESLSGENLRAFLQKKGLDEVHLQQWRELARGALGESTPPPDAPLKKEHQRLQKELRRKDKALAETEALLVLSKKVRAIWGDEDDFTP